MQTLAIICLVFMLIGRVGQLIKAFTKPIPEMVKGKKVNKKVIKIVLVFLSIFALSLIGIPLAFILML